MGGMMGWWHGRRDATTLLFSGMDETGWSWSWKMFAFASTTFLYPSTCCARLDGSRLETVKQKQSRDKSILEVRPRARKSMKSRPRASKALKSNFEQEKALNPDHE